MKFKIRELRQMIYDSINEAKKENPEYFYKKEDNRRPPIKYDDLTIGDLILKLDNQWKDAPDSARKLMAILSRITYITQDVRGIPASEFVKKLLTAAEKAKGKGIDAIKKELKYRLDIESTHSPKTGILTRTNK